MVNADWSQKQIFCCCLNLYVYAVKTQIRFAITTTTTMLLLFVCWFSFHLMPNGFTFIRIFITVSNCSCIESYSFSLKTKFTSRNISSFFKWFRIVHANCTMQYCSGCIIFSIYTKKNSNWFRAVSNYVVYSHLISASLVRSLTILCICLLLYTQLHTQGLSFISACLKLCLSISIGLDFNNYWVRWWPHNY